MSEAPRPSADTPQELTREQLREALRLKQIDADEYSKQLSRLFTARSHE